MEGIEPIESLEKIIKKIRKISQKPKTLLNHINFKIQCLRYDNEMTIRHVLGPSLTPDQIEYYKNLYKKYKTKWN